VQRKQGRRIQEILAEAAELFGERGYEAVSLDDVAERLDVTRTPRLRCLHAAMAQTPAS
jgi:AcrR family transcriptional regulator